MMRHTNIATTMSYGMVFNDATITAGTKVTGIRI